MESKEKTCNTDSKNEIIDFIKKYEIEPEGYAAIYARKSTLMDNNSIESQIEIAKKKLKELGLHLYNIYSDEESATKYHPIHRPGFKQLLLDAHKNKFKTLLVFRRDRLARRVEDLIEIKNIFKRQDIKIIYSNEGEFQSDNSYISSFIENVIISVDELEPAILAERIVSGIAEARLRGDYYFRAPYGLVKENGEYNHDGRKAEVIEEMFKSFELIDIFSEKDIFEAIRKQLVSKFSCELIKNLGKQKIKEYLKNPIYAGYITAQSKVDILDCFNENGEIDDSKLILCEGIKPIIHPRDRWIKIIKKYRGIERERDSYIDDEKHIFQDVLKCKSCGKPVHLIKKSFICSCGATNLPKSELEPILLRRIFMDIITDKNVTEFYKEQYKEYNAKVEELQDGIIQTDKDTKNELLNMLATYPNIGYDEHKKLIDKLQEEANEKYKLEYEKDMISNINNAVQYLLTKNEVKNIIGSDNFDVIINRLTQNVDYSQIIIKGLVNEILVKGTNKVDVYDVRNKKIEYKFKTDNRTGYSLLKGIH